MHNAQCTITPCGLFFQFSIDKILNYSCFASKNVLFQIAVYQANNSPSKLEGVPEGRGRVSSNMVETHTPPSQCWVEWQCLRHRTLHFVQHVLCHLPEHSVLRDTSPTRTCQGASLQGEDFVTTYLAVNKSISILAELKSII